jgi:predicted DNA-binding antitoxin AbrB/MazE fold protein
MPWCYPSGMRPVEALYENGTLKPAKPLNLRQGERVAVIVVRQPDASRWDIARLAAQSGEDEDLASQGLDDWTNSLDHEDRG